MTLKRFLDINLVLMITPLIFIPTFLIILIQFILSGPPIFFWSLRVGQFNKTFFMVKFRSMNVNAPLVETSKLKSPNQFYTSIGFFLRKFSLDEIPQLFNILKGDMSFVGPRPSLPEQKTLNSLREKKQIHRLKPGLTGLAQISGRDSLSIKEKINYDEIYLKNQSTYLDVIILLRTFLKLFNFKDISH